MSVRRVPSPPILDPSQSGPDFWVVRRAQWLTPPAGSKQDPVARNDHQIKRLVELLDEPGAAENDAYWFGGIQRVWKGLISSHPVKHPLPLRTVTRVLYTGWIKDGTWPKGAAVASSSDEIEPRPQHLLPQHYTSEMTPSSVTTPSSNGGA